MSGEKPEEKYTVYHFTSSVGIDLAAETHPIIIGEYRPILSNMGNRSDGAKGGGGGGKCIAAFSEKGPAGLQCEGF